jgi:hypothetical protein
MDAVVEIFWTGGCVGHPCFQLPWFVNLAVEGSDSLKFVPHMYIRYLCKFQRGCRSWGIRGATDT